MYNNIQAHLYTCRLALLVSRDKVFGIFDRSCQNKNQSKSSTHPRVPMVAVADYVSTSFSLLLAHPFQTFLFQRQPMNLPPWSVVRLWYIKCWVIWATHNSSYMQCLGQKWVIYWGSHQSCICLQIGVDICAVPTADTVATGEVNCYNCIVQLRALPSFVERIGQGYSSVVQQPWLVRMGPLPYTQLPLGSFMW